jgi:hypothetical protein
VHLRLAPGKDDPLNSKPSERFEMRLKVLGRYLPAVLNPPYVTHYATAIAAVVGKQNQDGQRLDKVIESWHGAYGGVRNCVWVAHSSSAVGHVFANLRARSQRFILASVQLEMKEKNGRYRAGLLKDVALPRPQEDSPLWFSQVEITRLHKLETLGFKRLPEIFWGVDKALDFNDLTSAPKGTAPSPRMPLGVHIRDENICVRSRHTSQFTCKDSRVEDVTDGKRAHNNIRHLRSKRKRKTIT